MKKGLIFILGMIAGAILTIGIAYLWSSSSATNSGDGRAAALYGDPGIALFDEPGGVMALKSFRLFQCLPNGTALAHSSEKAKVQYNWQYGDPVVFFLPEEGNSYYDDQIITVPTGKVVRQVGIYRYETKDDFVKQVPIVKIFDK